MTELRVADWSGVAAWYVSALELRVLLRDDPGEVILLAAGQAQLALKGLADVPPASSVRLVFEVADVNTAFASLQAMGVAASAPVDHPTEPFREIRLADPAGTPITLFSWTRDVPQA
jgi:hypothetical protein